MNVIEIEFLLNIAYYIFITMHKVLKGKIKYEKPKDQNYETILVMFLFLLWRLIQQHLSPFVLR